MTPAPKSTATPERSQPTEQQIPPGGYRGSCLCGAVSYRLHARIRAVTHCHCSQCRKSHGAAFASYGSVERSAFEYTGGRQLASHYPSSPGVTRTFCSRCGSSLFWTNSGGDFADWVSIALGTLDSHFEPSRHTHLHLDNTASWYGSAAQTLHAD